MKIVVSAVIELLRYSFIKSNIICNSVKVVAILTSKIVYEQRWPVFHYVIDDYCLQHSQIVLECYIYYLKINVSNYIVKCCGYKRTHLY